MDQSNNLIRSFGLSSGLQGVVATSPLSKPSGLAADGAGALYLTDTGNNRILKIDNQGTESILAAGLTSPTGIALDSAGNVFFSDPGSGGEITELPIGGGSPIQVGSALGSVRDLAVEPSGRVYFAGSQSISAIYQGAVRTNGYYNLAGSPTNVGLAIDHNGNLIVTNGAGGTYAQAYRGGSGFILAVPVGQTATCCDFIENIGNAPLTISGISHSSSPAFTPYTGSGQCTVGLKIQPAATCGVSVTFTPPAVEAYSETVTLTTDNLDAPGSQSTASLYGNGLQVPSTTTLTAPATAPIGGSVHPHRHGRKRLNGRDRRPHRLRAFS